MIKKSETFKLIPRGEREIIISREFDISRDMVFEAYTNPEMLINWVLGPMGWTMLICETVLRVGGTYKFIWKNKEGNEIVMGGVYQEIKRPEKIINTEKFFDAWYPGESLITTLFEDIGGKTKYTCTILYETHQAREVVLNSKIELGMIESFERLEDLLSFDLEIGVIQ